MRDDAAAVRVCSVSDIAAGTSKSFDVEGNHVAVVHLGDDWYAVGDVCSHEDYSLSEGDVWADERAIECPKHGSTFSLVTGEPQALPATTPIPVYEVRIDGDNVEVLLGTVHGAGGGGRQ